MMADFQGTAAASSKIFFGLHLLLQLVSIIKGEVQFNSTVAQDGSGNFTTISAAVLAAPNNSSNKYFIKIHSGLYREHVYVGPEKTNLVFIGDGMENTVITDNRSNSTGYGTYDSATVDVEGDGFIAQHITFRNSAGRTAGQAVALKCKSNFSAFFKCGFDAHQDTLLAFKGFQFYRECLVIGTVDFIFGDARAVLQKCDIRVRDAGEPHSSVITAQGKSELKEATGISIQNSTVMAATTFNPKSGTKTYLGRPWKTYSTAVFMQSFLDKLIDPVGWIPWGTNFSTLDSAFFGEYNNSGPGANISLRVSKGFRSMTHAEAKRFTVREFIQGDTWITQTQIPVYLDYCNMSCVNM